MYKYLVIAWKNDRQKTRWLHNALSGQAEKIKKRWENLGYSNVRVVAYSESTGRIVNRV